MPPSASQANYENILEKEVSWITVKWTKADLDYRLIYKIEDDRLIVLVLRVGHRKEIHR